MKLKHGLHLAYCTNIHRGESWGQTFESLQKYVLAVRNRLGTKSPYAIGLRLGADAARELSEPATLTGFQRWLEAENCYVFTINGFPYGRFHGTRVKEQVYAPDWTMPERVAYTNLLFDLLGEIVPAGVEGSVSTVPVSFKEFIKSPAQVRAARENLWKSVEHIERVSRRTGRTLHLGLEPEPLCYLETSAEAVEFIEQMRADRPGDLRLDEHLGVNYDCCHLALQYESPREALGRLRQHKIKVSKLHLSNALKVKPTAEVRQALRSFADEVYFHQVLARSADGTIKRHKDLDDALALHNHLPPALTDEWRIHFHIPLHCPPTPLFGTTADHVQGVLDVLKETPSLCSHLEMETYTWEVMPAEMKKRNVVDQLVDEYLWTIAELGKRGLA
ncbi:MAG: sugar phosphate isomerase/epimerase [Proteobacteria bacterium]|nr:sugar phosphate isomerase/epimerase [Pseudomonadota bacterium]